MKTEDFTKHPEILSILEDLDNNDISKKAFSDIVDGQNQYVELVQEGGGVLGVALVGYTYVMEMMNIRFLSLAGTSAGSINTMLIASLGMPDTPKAIKIIELLANKDLFDFVDGGKRVKSFLNALLNNTGKIGLLFRGIPLMSPLARNLGLNPGDNFLNWMKEVMGNVSSVDKLNEQYNTLPKTIAIRKGINRNLDGLKIRVAVIAGDVTTETKVEFPEMASLYWENPGEQHPADFVRASMSIPFFFEPYEVKAPPKGPDQERKWVDLASYRGPIPDKIHFVDGGILSNFPIDVFHREGVPRLPTFGVRLGVNRNSPNNISKLTQLTGAVFNSARHLYDYTFILKNNDYKHLIQHIDIGEHDWLNFNLSAKDKIDLFVRGARAAQEFLHKFDWDRYKEIRKG